MLNEFQLVEVIKMRPVHMNYRIMCRNSEAQTSEGDACVIQDVQRSFNLVNFVIN